MTTHMIDRQAEAVETRSMASFKLLVLFTVVSFLSFSTTEAQDSDSISPNYLHQNCSINKTTAGSAFQLNIGTLFSSLISNAAADSGFHNATVSGTNPSDTVYGLFMCRGDVPSQLCRQCVLNATQRLSSQCSLSKEAVIWYDECMVRYSSLYFFSAVETSPMFVELNTTSTLNPNFFAVTLSNTLSQLVDDTGDSNERYEAESLKLNALQTLYSLAQCTLDLASRDCSGCLNNVIGSAIPWARLESASGGRVLYPSCNMRFELFQFYRDDGGESQPPKPPSPSPSDFGLARIVENQDQGSTKRIAGTYGYMSPKYAMFGQFSEKSDIFSFGVMVLEIVSGKKNTSSYESHHANNLLSYVWRLWMDQTPLSILDPSIEENYSKIEVIKCIQIGLLCVQQNPDARPTMATVVSSLGNHSIELSTPQKPAFFLHTRMDSKAIAQESSSDQSTSTCPPFSINEMTTTDFLPR